NTTLHPGHDYQGFTSSTLKKEKQHNPRLQLANKKSYADFMMNLQLPNPKLMDIAVPANQSCGKIPDE
ncbi:MAG: MBL fold metallo-hydrolase, partial [Planktomarina sp.]|nr:MBL fold metallo-hydrolase [Planktomarina sp.]